MRRVLALLLFGASVTLAGCGGVPYSDPYASPDLSWQRECELRGGYWNRVANVCEAPLYR